MANANEAQTPRGYKPATPADKIEARTLYVKGAGSSRKVAEKLGLSPDTVRNWCDDENWLELREEYERRQLARLLGPEVPETPATPPIASQTPRQERIARIEARLTDLEEQMEGMTKPDALRDLTAAHTRLFDVYCTLTGIKKPGTEGKSRRPGRGPALSPSETPVEQPTQAAAA